MRKLAATLLLLAASAAPSFAHSSTRGFVMLLPTSYVILGGALAVLISFAVISLLRNQPRHGEPDSPDLTRPVSIIPSFLCAALVGILVWIGLAGPHDPAENLLPLAIWTLWWVVLVLLHPLLGNLWAVVNPFTGMHTLLSRISGGRLDSPPMQFPTWLAYWPAVLTFAAFAWFQLVDPAPEYPPRLAFIVMLYAVATMFAIIVFGPAKWLGYGDPFAIFFSQLGAAAPVSPLGVKLPGAGLLQLTPLPVAGMLFVLLTLSSISFDGFANTFFWLSMTGVNPLDYPGRTALMSANTWGLAGSFAALTLFYVATVCAGWYWAGRPGELSPLLGRFVLSLVPISIAYHFAHYLSGTLLNLQYLVLALNDPLQTSGNVLGLENMHVTASFQNTASGALTLFSIQTSAIVIGHIIAVAVSHTMAQETCVTQSNALKLELPQTIFMVLYTAFGLWLLATPAIS